MKFQFATASIVDFGAGSLKNLPGYAKRYGRRVLVVCGRDPTRAEPALRLLRDAGLAAETYSVHAEPTVQVVLQGRDIATAQEAEAVVGFGGGSAIDTAKAIAALMTNPGHPLDYLEVVGAGRPLEHPAVPCIAIPTTSGTGSEVTRNAVLDVPEEGIKASLRHVSMLPRCAIVDPDLTLTVPPAITAATGCDALTQVIEPLVSRSANPITDALCRDAIGRAASSLRQAYRNGSDLTARQDMALVSLFGGLALANAKLGAAHGFAGVLGGRFRAPHGELCAALLAPSMAINIQALRNRAPDSVALSRYAEVARLLCRDPAASAEDGVQWVRDLVESLDIRGLASLGVDGSVSSQIVEQASRSSSMKGNPLELLPDELHALLDQAM